MMKLIFMLINFMVLNYLYKFSISLYHNFFFFMMFFFILLFSGYKYIMVNMFMSFGIDLNSFFLIMLSMLMVGILFMVGMNLFYSKYFSFMLLFLSMMMIMYFFSLNYLMFFIFFEVSMIPMLFMVLGYGYQPERIQAGFYLMMYMIFSSLPLLMSIMNLMNLNSSLNLIFLFNSVNYLDSFIFYLMMVMVFLVKLPMFLVHLWLPKVHVEAPVFGSMILASVMLKLGGYGLLRSLLMMMNLCKIYNIIFISLSLMGGLIMSMVCLRSVDLKMLVAYSSIVHMSLVILGLFSMSMMGFYGAMILMVGHGLCSSSLFYLVNLNYLYLNSRSLLINKGLIFYFPSLSMWWFIMCMGNMGVPPTLNFVGELMIFMTMYNWSWVSLMILFFMLFFSGAYSLYLYSFTQHGIFMLNSMIYKFTKFKDFFIMVLHWVPLNLMFLMLL